MLGQVAAPIIGTVLKRVNESDSYAHTHGYSYTRAETKKDHRQPVIKR